MIDSTHNLYKHSSLQIMQIIIDNDRFKTWHLINQFIITVFASLIILSQEYFIVYKDSL